MVDWLEQPFSLKPKLLHQLMCCCTPSCTLSLLLAAGLKENSAAAFFCHPTPAVCTVPIVQRGLHCFGRFLPSRPLIGVRFPIGNNEGRVSKALMETKR